MIIYPKPLLVATALLCLSTANSVAQPATLPQIEATDCRFDLTGLLRQPQCYDLIVPEDRTAPDSPPIRIHAAVFPAADASRRQPDALLFLEGGPGGHALASAAFLIEHLNVFNTTRDVILFDQRGAGFSQPALNCPEVANFVRDHLGDDMPAQDSSQLAQAALRSCRDRLVSAGIDLSAYDTIANAADAADLWQALGYDTVNLFGVSYGTYLALTILRDHPSGVRSAILDSVLPLQVDAKASRPENAARAFRLLFDRCAADQRCNDSYPDLEARFYALAEQWDQAPVTVTARLPNGDAVAVRLTGIDVYTALFDSLYSTDFLPYIPRMIARATDGDDEQLATQAIIGKLRPLSTISLGMAYSMFCANEGSFPPAERTATDERLRGLRGDFGDFATMCGVWDVERTPPLQNEPVTSDIPTLLLAGEFDPATPPDYAYLAAETLSNTTVAVFPQHGHAVLTVSRANCQREVILHFLSNPSQPLDTHCTERIPAIRWVG